MRFRSKHSIFTIISYSQCSRFETIYYIYAAVMCMNITWIIIFHSLHYSILCMPSPSENITLFNAQLFGIIHILFPSLSVHQWNYCISSVKSKMRMPNDRYQTKPNHHKIPFTLHASSKPFNR